MNLSDLRPGLRVRLGEEWVTYVAYDDRMKLCLIRTHDGTEHYVSADALIDGLDDETS